MTNVLAALIIVAVAVFASGAHLGDEANSELQDVSSPGDNPFGIKKGAQQSSHVDNHHRGSDSSNDMGAHPRVSHHDREDDHHSEADSSQRQDDHGGEEGHHDDTSDTTGGLHRVGSDEAGGYEGHGDHDSHTSQPGNDLGFDKHAHAGAGVVTGPDADHSRDTFLQHIASINSAHGAHAKAKSHKSDDGGTDGDESDGGREEESRENEHEEDEHESRAPDIHEDIVNNPEYAGHSADEDNRHEIEFHKDMHGHINVHVDKRKIAENYWAIHGDEYERVDNKRHHRRHHR